MSRRPTDSSTSPGCWTDCWASGVFLAFGNAINLWSVDWREGPRFSFSSGSGKEAGFSAEASDDAIWEVWSEVGKAEWNSDRQATSISLTAASQSKSWKRDEREMDQITKIYHICYGVTTEKEEGQPCTSSSLSSTMISRLLVDAIGHVFINAVEYRIASEK